MFKGGSGILLALQSYMDDNGTVSWYKARTCATMLDILPDFMEDYGHMEGIRVDFGEYNVWARVCMELCHGIPSGYN